MRIIIGLGNPGPRFAKTRHNFGYWVVDALAASRGVSYSPGKGDYVMGIQEAGDVVLLKPTAFMNESGIPIREAMAFFQTVPEDILVVFDDIDLPLGTLRFRPGGGAGGHKGMSSIIYHLETEDFPRLRVGIATDAPLRPSEQYVLEPFRPRDEAMVSVILSQAVEGINHFLEHGIEDTMARFNMHLTETGEEERKAQLN
ncbi:MAG: aminoacyl-tRNA hydrolase [Fidelibacterota bacterium]|nr:MAG: aminoacyl-tRNA hydrolase [Candidatus Neomarinimicrobiota bacterium]